MTGFGYDVHRLGEGESLILGGVKIESSIGTIAHSDGDVLLHAVMDAILGAAGLGDIGEHFPDTDPEYKDADSMELLRHVIKLIENDYSIVNIDAMVVLEKPKLKDHKKEMIKNIAEACGLQENRVNIKATTNEKMGFIGRGEGIAVYAVCELKDK